VSDWYDEPKAVVKSISTSPRAGRFSLKDVPESAAERVRLFDRAWKKLSDEQRAFLEAWAKARFNKSRTLRHMGGNAPNQATEWRWGKNQHYAFVKKVMLRENTTSVLDRDRLAAVQEDCVQDLLEPQPILYMGEHTGFYENKAGAAAKVVADQLRLGGHLRDEQTLAPVVGPGLVIQVTSKIGEVISQVTVGVAPALPPPEDWFDA
jgi:hypothetical protein